MSKQYNGKRVNNQQLLSFSLKGFIFITAGEHSVTCGKKVMKPTNSIGNSQRKSVQSWIASCLAMTKCICYCLVHSSTRSPVPSFTYSYYQTCN